MYLPSYNLSSLSQLRITYVHNSMPNWCPKKNIDSKSLGVSVTTSLDEKKLQYYIWHCVVFISMSFLTHFPDSRIHPKFYCPTISPTAFSHEKSKSHPPSCALRASMRAPRATRAAAASHWPPMTACIKGVEPLAWKAILVAKWLCLRIVYCIYCISLQMAIFWWG